MLEFRSRASACNARRREPAGVCSAVIGVVVITFAWLRRGHPNINWVANCPRSVSLVACKSLADAHSEPKLDAIGSDVTPGGRRSVVLLVGAAAALLELAPVQANAAVQNAPGDKPPWPPLRAEVSLPLQYIGGGFCVQVKFDGSLFRGVLDTGSPFAVVSTCAGADCADYCSVWGCASPRFGKPVAINDSTIFYAAGRADVTWRRASVTLGGVSLGDLTVGVLKDIASLSGNGGGTFFGVLPRGISDPDVGGGAAVPSFLEQTNTRTLEIDLTPGTERLVLSSKALPARPPLAASIVPLVDLKSYGAPVQYYAADVSSLVIGEEVIQNSGRIIAVIDTGTTGLVLPSELYQVYVSTRRVQGRRIGNKRAATVEVALAAERGDPVRFSLRQGAVGEYGGASFDIVTPLPVPDGMVPAATALWAGGDVGMPPGVVLEGNIARQMGSAGVSVRGEKKLTPGERFSVRLNVCKDDFCEIAVGLGPIPLTGNLGEMESTCAYTRRGRMLFEGEGTEETGPRLRAGDTIECGLTLQGEVYWELDGRRFGQTRFNTSQTVYPWVSLVGAEVEFSGPVNSGLAPPLPPSERPFVIFMGLGFFLGRRMRIDTVARRAAFD